MYSMAGEVSLRSPSLMQATVGFVKGPTVYRLLVPLENFLFFATPNFICMDICY